MTDQPNRPDQPNTDVFASAADATYRRLVDKFGAQRVDQIAARFPAAVGIAPVPGSDADRLADEILSDMLAPDDVVARFYEQTAPTFLAAYATVSRLPELERIAVNAVEADRRLHRDDIGGPWVILTSRPGDRYTLADRRAFDLARKLADQYIACDLNMGQTGYCVSEMQMIKRHKLGAVAPDGAMLNQPFTFPFAYQDYVVVSRICFNCWVKFVKKYKLKNPTIQHPWETVN